jgi:hypothetical protein
MAFGTKSYGDSKIDKCVVCSASAYKKNEIGIPVCSEHENAEMPAWKCPCGNWLDILYGKYGAYCNCPRCGNQNLEKMRVHNLENPPTLKSGKAVSSLASVAAPVSSAKFTTEAKRAPVKKEVSSIFPIDIPDDCDIKF